MHDSHQYVMFPVRPSSDTVFEIGTQIWKQILKNYFLFLKQRGGNLPVIQIF